MFRNMVPRIASKPWLLPLGLGYDSCTRMSQKGQIVAPDEVKEGS